MSYAAIPAACAPGYRVLQVSPRTPDASRRPQQPTCRGRVRHSRAAPSRDSHPFVLDRVHLVAEAPVSVSPNPAQPERIGSNRGIAPRSARRMPRQLHYEHAASAVTGGPTGKVGPPPPAWRRGFRVKTTPGGHPGGQTSSLVTLRLEASTVPACFGRGRAVLSLLGWVGTRCLGFG